MSNSQLSQPRISPAVTPAKAASELLRRRAARSRLIDFCCYVKADYETALHLEMLAAALERVERGELKRLIVTMPPRHGKTTLVSLLFPCWYMARHPYDMVVQAGYAESIALTHSRRARDIFISPEFIRLFPDVHHRPERTGQEAIVPPRQAAHEWGTQQGGSYYAVGIGGGLTGRGFNLGIIDDPVSDAEAAGSTTIRNKTWEWYSNVFYTRMEPGAAAVVVMTRWHADDLVGRLLAQAQEVEGADQWEVLHMPAINGQGEALWSDRFPLEKLEAIRNSTTLEPGAGSRAFEALYQGRPSIVEGNIIKREWWKYYTERPVFTRIIHSWDTGFKTKEQSDPSVCTVWGEAANGYYLLDVFRARVEFPELKRTLISLYERDHPQAVLVEDAASGQSLIQEIQRDTLIPILPVKVDRDKVARVNAITPLIEAGRVYLTNHASWLYDYVEELSGFPNMAHDDQVDSTTQALIYMAGRVASSVTLETPTRERRQEREEDNMSMAGIMRREF